MIYEFNGYRPVVDPSAFVHPQAAVTGNVIIGREVYIGPGAAIRGDWGEIIISDGCNVQENCTIHMFPGITVRLEEGAHIGHGAIIHGAHIGRNCLVGMNAVLMDNVELGDECIVGALSFLKADSRWSTRSLIVGNPAKVIKQVSDEMIEWKSAGTRLYQQLPSELHATLRQCEPLREIPTDRPPYHQCVSHLGRDKKLRILSNTLQSEGQWIRRSDPGGRRSKRKYEHRFFEN